MNQTNEIYFQRFGFHSYNNNYNWRLITIIRLS